GENDVRFLWGHIVPGGLPSLLGHLADAFIQSLRAFRSLNRSQGVVAAKVIRQQDRNAEAWKKKRALTQIIHFKRENVLAIMNGDQSPIPGVRVRVDHSLKKQGGANCGWLFASHHFPVEGLK